MQPHLLLAASLLLAAPVNASTPVWVPCSRNPETGQYTHVRGARALTLSADTPFIIDGAPVHPKFQLTPGVDHGACLIEGELNEAIWDVQW